ncbi:MAG: cation transporter [Clostridia bacterium]|nr:cation transporter [Clostridia bacterium]
MKRIYLLKNLGCANCAAKMERKIAALQGVLSVNIQFMSTKMTLELDDAAGEALLPEIEGIVKKTESQVELIRIG